MVFAPVRSMIPSLKLGDCLPVQAHKLSLTCNIELNYLRMNHKFEKITLFPHMNFRQHLTYNSRGDWHTLYAMLLSKYE